MVVRITVYMCCILLMTNMRLQNIVSIVVHNMLPMLVNTEENGSLLV